MPVAHRYPEDILPPGFEYPEEFKQIEGHPEDYLHPWEFINPDSDFGRLAFEIAQGYGLIPFARHENRDGDMACFRSSQDVGEPKIQILILDGSGRSYGFESFSEWLERARRDAADQKQLPPLAINGWSETTRFEHEGRWVVLLADAAARFRYVVAAWGDHHWEWSYESGLFSDIADAERDARLYLEA